MVTGSTVWGHNTGVTENNIRTFSGNWTGTASILGSGDDEDIILGIGEYMVSEIAYMGTSNVRINQNVYITGGFSAPMYYRTSVTESGIISDDWVLYTGQFASLGYVQIRLGVSVPLVVSNINARYLVDATGAPVMLIGFHTWGDVQDSGLTSPPPAFDWDEYITALVDYGCNFTKLWTYESPVGWGYYRDPVHFARSSTPGAADGGNKFDLAQIDQDWIDRLRARAVSCAAHGIYACVQLFQGWDVELKWAECPNPMPYHPFLSTNNINSVDGDPNDDDSGAETRVVTSNPAISYQEDEVTAVVTALNDLDNIIYEISNEDAGSAGNTAWQEYWMDFIRDLEATLPKQHLVGMTVQYPNGDNEVLDSSSADWVSYKDRTQARDGTKANMGDTDHIEGDTQEYAWIWLEFCIGSGGLWFMDMWDGNGWGSDTRNDAECILVRENLGYAKALFALLNNLLLMTPQPTLSTSGYCLARDHATAGEYVAYYDGSSTFNLDLSNATGTLNVRWLRCSDGTVQDSATVSGGDVRTLTPPWTGRVVAYVRHT